jgi:hypothetical protein
LLKHVGKDLGPIDPSKAGSTEDNLLCPVLASSTIVSVRTIGRNMHTADHANPVSWFFVSIGAVREIDPGLF